MRIRITWVAVLALVAILLLTKNAWDRMGATLFAETLYVTAIALGGIAAVGRLWCSLYIAGKKQGMLVVQGPYSLCRNPLYLFSLIGAIGFGLATKTLTIPIIIGAAFVAYYPFVIRQEEKALLAIHGEAYAAYCHSTPRFFPRFTGLVEPDSYSIDPKTFRKHCFSAIWFVVLIGVPKLIETLHEMRLIPTLFCFY